MASVFVVVPTFNEVENVTRLVDGVLSALPECHVLVVDDASPDGTADAVDAMGDRRVSVLRRSGKNGLGAAYRAGFAEAIGRGATVCVQMDADLSHDPCFLAELVSVVERGADASIGSRYVPGGGCVDWPRLRQFLSRWGNRYAAGMLGLAVNDATSGYRAYSASVLARMNFETVGAEGYGFQVEMTHRLVRCGARVVEIPIVFADRTAGESKLTYRIIGEAFRLVVRLAWRDWKKGHRRRL